VTWVAVAIGGSALIGAGSSYLGSKQQAKGAQKASDINLGMFNTLNQQQQPFIQSGYGAMGRLNTLLGLSPNPNAQRMPQPMPQGPAYRPTPGGGVEPIMQAGPQGPPAIGIPERAPNARLSQLLALRAAHGDTQAQAILQRMS
jgi:hypothetical protein